jgi:hypothetical protein
MPLYVFRCPTHGRLEVRLPAGRAFYLCERCGQFCERDSTTLSTRLGANSPRAEATAAARIED